MNRYSEWGSRKAYLGDLADQYGVLDFAQTDNQNLTGENNESI